ncbi:MAG: hypothetical protein AB8G15_10360 [Saprospiraceae bacterium]
MRLSLIVAIIYCLSLFTACTDDTIYTPKPRGFPKVIYPERGYQNFIESYCDFSFEYPKYARVIQDTVFFDEKPVNPCWFDLYFPNFDARIHCSYYPIDQVNSYEKLREDAFQMATEHSVKADYIDELPIRKPNGTLGFVFDLDGPVASPFQFYLSDSTTHFIRGALYFNTRARPDSLAPITNFIKTDIMYMINSFEWDRSK